MGWKVISIAVSNMLMCYSSGKSREIPVVDRQDFICLTRILYHFKADNVSFNLVQSAIETKDLAIRPDLDYNHTWSQKLGMYFIEVVK